MSARHRERGFYWFAEIKLAPQVANQDIRPWQEDCVKILVAADCTGHGVPGAFMTVMGNDFLNEIVMEKGVLDPAQILYELDAKISQALQKQSTQTQLADGMDLSLIALNQKRGEMIFSGAKNPLYFVRQGQLREIIGSKFPIGGNHFYKQKAFENQAIVVRPGDRFYMFSDGFQDQFSGKSGRKFMKKRFRETIAQMSTLPMSAQKQRLEAILKDWKGDYFQTDDILVVGVEI
ncbi:MAG: serine/threonine-protein phosphatase [Microscillaceae bacterium]|nr:serine/threonine-protein phosphatase [Microscillaceae bacterium]